MPFVYPEVRFAIGTRLTAEMDIRLPSRGDGRNRIGPVFARCFEELLGLTLRRREAKRCIKAAAKSCAKVRWISENQALFLPKVDDFDLSPLLDAITGQLDRIARRPLTARELLTTVPISNKERLKWTKDGRLVQQGSTSIKRGQLISLTTYAIAPVEELLANLDEIERWRARDLWLETR